MQQKYIEHFVLMELTKFLEEPLKKMPAVPYSAILQNYFYYPDPGPTKQLRVQRLVSVLLKAAEILKDQPDPDPAPRLIELGDLLNIEPVNISVPGAVSLEDVLKEA